jgi:hypothetical protein
MALLRMLSRSAFMCNVCFLLAICMLWIRHPINPGLASLIIVMGFLVSVLLNIVVNLWMIILRMANRPLNGVPRLLIYLNGGFLAIQLILLLK